MQNRFFIWKGGRPAATEFTPGEMGPDGEITDTRYFTRTLKHVDEMLGARGLKFLVTWNLDAFTDEFRDAVVLLVGDERYQVPSYAPAVRAIFKTGGRSPNPLSATLRLPFGIAWRTLLRDTRNVATARRRAWQRIRGRPAPIHEMPLGYFRQLDVPPKLMVERSTDVFFAGTIPPVTVKTGVRPAAESRRRMAAALAHAQTALPSLRFRLSYAGAAGLGPSEYSSALVDSKIALCPRGNFDETFRLFEAARAGCVAITEPLPRRWYYEGAPVVTLRDWSELTSVLTALQQRTDLAEAGQRMRRWWDERLAESVLARFICKKLGEVTVTSSALLN